MKNFYLLLIVLLCFNAFAEKDTKQQDEKWDVNNPPGETFTATIKTDNGTWMNLDVNASGNMIAFDLLGDIYTMPISGGKATNITNSMAWDMQPRFSPDGHSIAFTTDQGGGDNIWTMNVDGSNQKQVSNEKFRLLNQPAWSIDSQYIIARKHFTGMRSIGSGEIWMYHKSGGDGVQLNKRPNEQKDLGEPVFTPDGKYVLYSRDATPGKIFEYSKDSNNQIYNIEAIDLKTGEIDIWVNGAGGAVRPTPSPDGKTLAFVRRVRNDTTLFLQDRESGKLTSIYSNLERDMQETWAIHGVYPTFAWMPNGKEIVFYAKGKIHKINTQSKAVSNIPFSVDDTRKLSKVVKVEINPAPEKFNAKMLRWLHKSSDGKTAVFQSLGYIYTVKLPDGKPKRLTKQNKNFEQHPKFSPDGKSIVYTTWNDKNLGTVQMVSLSGKSKKITRQVTKQITRKPGHYINPSISPDNKTVVFKAIGGGHLTSPLYSQDRGIFIIDRESGVRTLINKSGFKPFFAKDSKRVFYTTSDKKGEVITTQLISTDLSGNKQEKHYSGTWITDYSISPDNKWLAFIQNFQVYVTPFIQSGKFISTGSKASNFPLQKFSKNAGNYLTWLDNSSELSWALGANIYQQKLNDKFEHLGGNKDNPAQTTAIALNVNADIPSSNVLLKGATIITMKGDQVIENGMILIKNNRIVEVGTDIKSDATVIDVTGKTIMPGIVDVHWHGPYANNQIIPQTNWNALVNLAFGVTTEHNPSANTEAVFAASEMQQAGVIVAPRTFSTGTILYGATQFISAPVNSLEDAIGHLERMKDVGAFSVKSYNQPRRDQRQQIIEAARQTNLMVVPEGGSLLQHNLNMIVDGHTGIEHSIPVAAIYDDVLQLWSQSETAYTPTLTVAFGGLWGEKYWYDTTEVWEHPLLTKFVPEHILEPVSIRRTKAPVEDYNHIRNAEVATKLQNAGVKVLLGAHGQREGLGSHWEMWMFAQGGMSPLNVIRAATIDGAKYIGMDKDLGSLEKGKLADLIILDANPLDNIRNSDKVHQVMLNGRLYDAQTMDQVFPEKVKRAKFYFED
ncbi:MAG: amidohydrolase family protein [Proteobacteria bacterium]|nr:amidohydrolase family protein [Pseudomonadota bacterium]